MGGKPSSTRVLIDFGPLLPLMRMHAETAGVTLADYVRTAIVERMGREGAKAMKGFRGPGRRWPEASDQD